MEIFISYHQDFTCDSTYKVQLITFFTKLQKSKVSIIWKQRQIR